MTDPLIIMSWEIDIDECKHLMIYLGLLDHEGHEVKCDLYCSPKACPDTS